MSVKAKKLGSLSATLQVSLIEEALPRLSQRLRNEHPEVLDVSVGPRLQGEKFRRGQMSLKVVVGEKKENVDNLLPLYCELTTDHPEAIKRGETRRWLVPVDVVEVNTKRIEPCSAGTYVTNRNRLGMVSARVGIESGRKAWLTAAHVLYPKQPDFDTYDLYIRDDRQKFSEAYKASAWLKDKEGYWIDAAVANEIEWNADPQLRWDASSMSSWVRNKSEITHDKSYGFRDQFGRLFSNIRLHMPLAPGTAPYFRPQNILGYYPQIFLFYDPGRNQIPEKGDSGGPLWAYDNGRRYLVGVVSSYWKYREVRNFVVVPYYIYREAYKRENQHIIGLRPR